MDRYKQEFEAVRTRMSAMEEKYTTTVREKNDIIQKLCVQLQKCSDELKNSTRELLDQNKKRVNESLANTKKLLSEVNREGNYLTEGEQNDIQYKSYAKALEASNPKEGVPAA